jgi:hypothetical protein
VACEEFKLRISSGVRPVPGRPAEPGDGEGARLAEETLSKLLSASAARLGWADEAQRPSSAGGHLLARPTMDFVKKAFLRCHRTIWKSEKVSPQAAFVEFAKLLFVKSWEDRRIRDNPELLAKIGQNETLPNDEVRFSKHWIHAQERNAPNPIADASFRQLVDSIEAEIAQKRRKRIFEANEHLNLSPGTVKLVVEQLEGYYLFGIDEDLNRRMFDAFFDASSTVNRGCGGKIF